MLPYANTGGCPVAEIPLPIKLLSFQGAVVNGKAQLNWLVDDNHTGDRFQIEKSNDGKNFSVNSVLFTTTKIGTETYTYTENAKLEGGAYYRIKIINKDNSVSYSKIVFLKNTTGNTTEEIYFTSKPDSICSCFFFQRCCKCTCQSKPVQYGWCEGVLF